MFTSPLHARLDELALIEITGPDAFTFLHGQLTQDISGLPLGQARLAGYCTAKGRLLATLVVWRSGRQDDSCRALVRADLADALVKRLSMFVLRAKVRVQCSPALVWGAGLPADHAAAAAAAWAVLEDEEGDWVRAPGADAPVRSWFIASEGRLPPGVAVAGWADAWRVRDIGAGLPWVQSATQEVFIPQTLNLDLIDGVSFTKGCYPGQEVVARSHYRGTVKRRMAAGRCQAPVDAATDTAVFAPGADIYDARRPDAPWGRVVNLQVFEGQAWLLFEAQLADLDEAQLRLGGAEGPAIQLLDLPYAITA